MLNGTRRHHSRVADNEEILSIKKILGLEAGKVYTGLEDLRWLDARPHPC
jgi:DNA gyrase/topoisomerase IV subunit B